MPVVNFSDVVVRKVVGNNVNVWNQCEHALVFVLVPVYETVDYMYSYKQYVVDANIYAYMWQVRHHKWCWNDL